MLIREIQLTTPEDYEAVAAVSSAVWPELPTTSDLVRKHDEDSRAAGLIRRRYVAEYDGKIIATGSFQQSTMYWFQQPGRFGIDISVPPDLRRQGIGAQLYDRMMTDLNQLHPVELFAYTTEDRLDGMRFIQQRGFTEAMRNCESVLDIAAFDPQRFAAKSEQVRASGVEIRSFAELASDAERDQKLYELDRRITPDIPTPGAVSDFTLEQWQREHSAQNPDFLPHGMFVALENGHYIGVTELLTRGETDLLETHLTGVLPEYRRRGIALALKLHALIYSKTLGKRSIITWNEEHNPMFDLNIKLGFVKQPSIILYIKR